MKKAEKRKLMKSLAVFGNRKFIDTPVKRYSSGNVVRLHFRCGSFTTGDFICRRGVGGRRCSVSAQVSWKKWGGRIAQEPYNFFVSHNMAAIENLCTRCVCWMVGAWLRWDTKTVVKLSK